MLYSSVKKAPKFSPSLMVRCFMHYSWVKLTILVKYTYTIYSLLHRCFTCKRVCKSGKINFWWIFEFNIYICFLISLIFLRKYFSVCGEVCVKFLFLICQKERHVLLICLYKYPNKIYLLLWIILRIKSGICFREYKKMYYTAGNSIRFVENFILRNIRAINLI